MGNWTVMFQSGFLHRTNRPGDAAAAMEDLALPWWGPWRSPSYLPCFGGCLWSWHVDARLVLWCMLSPAVPCWAEGLLEVKEKVFGVKERSQSKAVCY